jgi:hypothetical protein
VDAGRNHLDLFGSFGIEADVRAEVFVLPPASVPATAHQFATALEGRLMKFHTAWDEKWVQLQELVHRLAFGRLRGEGCVGHSGEPKKYALEPVDGQDEALRQAQCHCRGGSHVNDRRSDGYLHRSVAYRKQAAQRELVPAIARAVEPATAGLH